MSGAPGSSGLQGLASRFDWEWLNAPRVRRRALYAAGALFFVGSAWAAASRPDLLTSLRWAPALVQVAFAIPLTVVLNSAEFWLSVRMLGSRVSFGQALEVSTLGSAANLFPIPGGFLVRVAQLRAGGVSVGRATSVNVVLALAWIGIAFAYAGFWLALLSRAGLGAALGAVGVAALAGVGLLVRALGVRSRFVAWMLLNKAAIVALESVRVLLCFHVLGLSVAYAQAAALVVASVLGSATSIVPAGLGVREAVSAGLAPLVGVAASAGFLVAAVSRILEVLVLVPLALVLGRRIAEPPETEARPCDP